LDEEFEALLKQLDALCVFDLSVMPPGMAPTLVARRLRDEYGPAKAIQGCKQAINDCLEALSHAPPSRVAAVSERLAALGAPPLHALLSSRAGSVRRLLNQKRLRNQAEYYLLREIVLNESASFTADERARAARLIDTYETSL
jgi:hypothetical protein